MKKKNVTLEAEDKTWIYGLSPKLYVHIHDSEGNNVTGGQLTFENVFGRNYTADVLNGIATSKVHAGGIGLINVTCRYSGNDIYNNASTILHFNIPQTNTSCSNIVATRYNDTVYFTGNVVCDYRPYIHLDNFDDYEEVTEGYLEVFVDGERLGTCDVDFNGNFVYIWKTRRNLIGETINFTANYKHKYDYFNPSTFSKNFTFSHPTDTQIKVNVNVSDVGEILINGHVEDSNGKGVIGGQINYNTAIIPVDANGNFKFYLTEKTISKTKYETGFMDWGSKADITLNIPLMNAISHTPLTEEIIELCKQGSPYIKFGNGNGKTIIMSVGTHGGELASQAAGFKLINLLAEYGEDINGTIYIFPVLFPQATANNTRVFNGTNLNSVATENGSISNSLIKFALSVNASGLGDFHCTRHSDSDVGITCAMGSYNPVYESFLIADYIHNQTGYDEDIYDMAGDPYAGAIEDFANLNGIPAVTCEALTNHRAIEYGSSEVSFNMMKSFLKYFGLNLDEIIKIPFNNTDMNLTFTSPYNYVSSSLLINKDSFKVNSEITANPTSFIINYGGEYSVTIKDINGKPITGKEISFTLNGKNIGACVSNNQGIAAVTLTAKLLKSLKTGSKNLVVEFKGDENYTSVKKTVKLTVNKEKTKIVAGKKTFKKSIKVKKYTISLKNSKGKAIQKVKVTLKVKGKTFKAKTNSKGKAIFKIKKLTKKGTFKAKIIFNGDNYYNKVSKNVNIKIK